jgi:4-hydroxy-3-polyprenylbenzoate decarboxylase
VNAPLVVGVTGASGAPYGLRLIRALIDLEVPTYLVISSHGWRLMRREAGIDDEAALRTHVGGDWSRITLFPNDDRGAIPASGSAVTRGMVVCPCSMGTLAAIANGTSRSLIERAADVMLKERRRLVLVPRETPLSEIHLRNMLTATQAGAVVMPAAPGFYNLPRGIDDLIDFIVARVLDQVGIEHDIGRRWSGE